MTAPVIVAIDARHEHVYLQTFAPGGRTVIAPRLAPIEEAVRRPPKHLRASSAPWHDYRRQGCSQWARCRSSSTPRRARHRLGRLDRRGASTRISRRRNRFICVRLTRSRSTPPNCRADDGPESFPPAGPHRAELTPRRGPRDAAAIAALHGASFQRGWGEDEVYRLLIENNVVAHRAMTKGAMTGARWQVSFCRGWRQAKPKFCRSPLRRSCADAAWPGHCST